MDFKTFIDSYWELFLTHLCRFHPLDQTFIERFNEDLDWVSLSQNTVILWDQDFIAKWESKWLWHELAMNPAITWNDEMIKRFKKRLDTYYLVRNINLPLTEEFIAKHLKTSHFVENNNYLTPELKEKYRHRLMPVDKPAVEPDKLIELRLDELIETLDNWKYLHAQPVLYEQYILPNVKSVEELFKNKFTLTQRWYYMSGIHTDIHGLTPGYKGDPNNPFESYENDRNIFNVAESITVKFIPDSGSEGPDRLFEVLRSSTIERYAALLISENIKSVFSKFKLPTHRYFNAEVKAKKVNSNVSFYVLQFNRDTIYQDISLDTTAFKFRKKRFSSRTRWKPILDKITSTKELAEKYRSLLSSTDKISTFIEILPTEFVIDSDYDLYTLDNKIIVNEFVKGALESNFPNQVNFRSAQLLNISMRPSEYEKKRLVKLSITNRSDIFSVPEMEQHYITKRDRLERQNIRVSEKLIQEDEFKTIQLKLNVIITDIFKHFYKSNAVLGDYSFLPINKFYQEDQYSSSHPESFKAIVVGENGIGDSIGLMLEKEDDYRLQGIIYEFLHETGEIQRYHLQMD